MSSNNKPTVFLIRHGEKPPKLPSGEDQEGLDALGLQRSQALVGVFGQNSPYRIGLILAEHYKKNGHRTRPYLTIKPLYESMADNGVQLNTNIDRDDAQGVANAITSYPGPGNILVCWEHGQLLDIAQAMGVTNAAAYPSDRFDLIWTVEPPYNQINNITSEHCPGLDDAFSGDP